MRLLFSKKMQLAVRNEQHYSDDLFEKSFCVTDYYEEEILEVVFIEGVDTSIQHSNSNSEETGSNVDFADITFLRKLLSEAQDLAQIFLQRN